MFTTIKNILGFGTKANFTELVQQGAVILDVRTQQEFKEGHIEGAKNISVDQLKNNLNKLNKDQAIITCCASGMRSAAAKNILKVNGFKDVHNGGAWTSLYNKLNQ